MASKMGNPEGNLGNIDRKQVDDANLYFGDQNTYAAQRRRDVLDQMENAAGQYLANKHPGGPR